jgi:hypothetical protein
LTEKTDSHPNGQKITYWHRDLPPADAEPMGEHTVEATSKRVPGTIAHQDELWNQCYEDLMALADSLTRRAKCSNRASTVQLSPSFSMQLQTPTLATRFPSNSYKRPPVCPFLDSHACVPYTHEHAQPYCIQTFAHSFVHMPGWGVPSRSGSRSKRTGAAGCAPEHRCAANRPASRDDE